MQNLSGYNSAITVNLLRNTNKYTNIQHLHDENQHPSHTETLTNTCIASQTKSTIPITSTTHNVTACYNTFSTQRTLNTRTFYTANKALCSYW